MPLTFNVLLQNAGISVEGVRLLRHQDSRATLGRTPYRLWMDDRPSFERYQRSQSPNNRAKLSHPYWAVFVGTPEDETLFVGLYDAHYAGLAQSDQTAPHNDQVDAAGTYDVYDLHLSPALAEYAGKLCVDWGDGYRSWIQRADAQDKHILELRRAVKDPEFPGYLRFQKQLSDIEALPLAWHAALSASRGIYLLTCPKTHEQYVGAALGERGFLGRWLEYVRTGHGGNVALKSRVASDYRVSILEAAASSATSDEILALEAIWKEKLQSREMGLNRN